MNAVSDTPDQEQSSSGEMMRRVDDLVRCHLALVSPPDASRSGWALKDGPEIVIGRRFAANHCVRGRCGASLFR
jgi:hypothetical protein